MGPRGQRMWSSTHENITSLLLQQGTVLHSGLQAPEDTLGRGTEDLFTPGAWLSCSQSLLGDLHKIDTRFSAKTQSAIHESRNFTSLTLAFSPVKWEQYPPHNTTRKKYTSKYLP